MATVEGSDGGLESGQIVTFLLEYIACHDNHVFFLLGWMRDSEYFLPEHKVMKVNRSFQRVSQADSAAASPVPPVDLSRGGGWCACATNR